MRSGRRLTRRWVAVALGAVGMTLVLPGAARKQPASVLAGRECGGNDGVVLLRTWFEEGLTALGLELGDFLPLPEWESKLFPTGMSLRYPPDWTAEALYADTYSDSGRPIWTDERLAVPQLQAMRLVSPDGKAAFEFAVGNIQGILLEPDQSAWIAAQSLLGDEPTVEVLGGFEVEDTYGIAPGWFRAGEADRSLDTAEDAEREATLIVVAGTNSHLASVAPGAFPDVTTATYYAIGGPEGDFEELTRDVFLRVLFQFLGGEDAAGGGDDGTEEAEQTEEAEEEPTEEPTEEPDDEAPED